MSACLRYLFQISRENVDNAIESYGIPDIRTLSNKIAKQLYIFKGL